jgi:hypothetical protein
VPAIGGGVAASFGVFDRTVRAPRFELPLVIPRAIVSGPCRSLFNGFLPGPKLATGFAA